jgi:hypothetical protein
VRDFLSGRYRVTVWIPVWLALTLWLHGPRVVSRSGYRQTEKALGALKCAFDSRDQADVVFEPAFLEARRSIGSIFPAGSRWWPPIDPDRLVQNKATTCLALLRSYRDDLRSAELSLDLTGGRRIERNGEFASALVDAERQVPAAKQCMSDVEGYLHW